MDDSVVNGSSVLLTSINFHLFRDSALSHNLVGVIQTTHLEASR